MILVRLSAWARNAMGATRLAFSVPKVTEKVAISSAARRSDMQHMKRFGECTNAS